MVAPIPQQLWKAPAIPVASYSPANRQASVQNGYSVRAMLKSAGFTYHGFSQTWRRTYNTTEDFMTDWPLLEALHVELDEYTTQLVQSHAAAKVQVMTAKVAVAKAEHPAPKPLHAPSATPLHAAKPTVKVISPIEGLRLAKERLCRLAASGRIVDAEDLKTLRECAMSIKAVLDEQARIEAEEQAYGSWQEEFAEDIAHEA